MNAHADRVTHRSALVFVRQTLLVDAVTSFMDSGKQRMHRVLRQERSGDPGISGIDAVCERMGGYIKPPCIIIESQRSRNLFTEEPLLFDVKGLALEQIVGGFIFRGLQLLQHRDQCCFCLREQLITLYGGQSFFIFIEQGIVRILCAAEIMRLFPHGFYHLLQFGGKKIITILRLRFLPDVKGFTVQGRGPGDKFRGQFDRPFILTFPFPQVRSFVRHPLPVRSYFQQLAEVRFGQFLMIKFSCIRNHIGAGG